MKCEKCGMPLVKGNEKFCPGCGSPIQINNVAITQPEINQNNTVQPDLINNQPNTNTLLQSNQPSNNVSEFNQPVNYNQPQQTTSMPTTNDDELLMEFIGKNYNKLTKRKFNFAGFFFGSLYMFYRKMALFGIIYMIINLLVNKFINNFLILLAINLVVGFFVNKLYLSYANKKIEKIKLQNQNNPTAIKNECRNKGGTSVAYIFLAILISGILSTVVEMVFPSKDNQLKGLFNFEITDISEDSSNNNTNNNTNNNNNTNTSQSSIENLFGYWVSTDKKAVASFTKPEEGGLAGNYFSYISNEDMVLTSFTVKDNKAYTDDNKEIVYSIKDNKLTLTYEDINNTFVSSTEKECEEISQKIAEEMFGSFGNIDIDDSEEEEEEEYYYDDRIDGTWYNASDNITISISSSDEIIWINYVSPKNSFMATATMDATTLDIYGQTKYSYKFSGQNLVLTDTSTNQSFTFVAK